VFDSFVRADLPDTYQPRLEKVVVTIGTYRGYGFQRLIRRLLEILPPETDVLWQTGDTDVSGFGIEGHDTLPERELTEAMREADVVIAHAGIGTALAAFEVGKSPLLVPRRAAWKEHVDDHQIQIANELGSRGLTVSIEADKLTHEDLLAAVSRRVTTPDQVPEFETR
jgi:UDP-N-acetylglucosamine transferase subunit ALG13